MTPSVAIEIEAPVTSRFYVARGTIAKTPFDLAIERRGEDAFALFSTGTAGRVVSLRGRATSDGDGFRFALDAHGLRVDGRIAAGVVRELFVRERDGKSPVAATLDALAHPDFEATYAGSLDAHVHIRMKLARTGDTLTGVYRYPQSTDDMRLAGHVASDGTFELDETAGANITGRFTGALAGKLGIVARWTSADGKRSYDVTLVAGPGYPETYAMTANAGRIVPRERYTKVAQFCEDSRIVPAFEALRDTAAQRTLDATLAQQASLFGPALTKRDCDRATEELPFERAQTFSVDGERPGFVGITSSLYAFTGGAHGSYASHCFVVDLQKHVVVRLASQVTPSGLAKLRALVIKTLERENKVTKLTEAGFFEDAPTLADADLCFAVDHAAAKLRVDFPLYAIAPYVMGAPSVAVDASDVSGVFQPGATGALLFP